MNVSQYGPVYLHICLTLSVIVDICALTAVEIPNFSLIPCLLSSFFSRTASAREIHTWRTLSVGYCIFNSTFRLWSDRRPAHLCSYMPFVFDLCAGDRRLRSPHLHLLISHAGSIADLNFHCLSQVHHSCTKCQKRNHHIHCPFFQHQLNGVVVSGHVVYGTFQGCFT